MSERVIVVPGLNDSGTAHWQSEWLRLYRDWERVQQSDWSTPDLAGWSQRIIDLLEQRRGSAWLVAHSFGCLAAVHVADLRPGKIRGLFLVAPADPVKFSLEEQLPHQRLDCPAMVVASADDPWMRLSSAAYWARHWGASFRSLGAAGHINSESGYGPWPEGRRLLHSFRQVHALALQGNLP